MSRINRTIIAEDRPCPTCQRPMRLHEWATRSGNGSTTPWTRSRISCDAGCSMTGIRHTVADTAPAEVGSAT